MCVCVYVCVCVELCVCVERRLLLFSVARYDAGGDSRRHIYCRLCCSVSLVRLGSCVYVYVCVRFVYFSMRVWVCGCLE